MSIVNLVIVGCMPVNQVRLSPDARNLAGPGQIHKHLLLRKMVHSFISSLAFSSRCLLTIYSAPSSMLGRENRDKDRHSVFRQ